MRPPPRHAASASRRELDSLTAKRFGDYFTDISASHHIEILLRVRLSALFTKPLLSHAPPRLAPRPTISRYQPTD